LQAADILSSNLGESEKNLKTVFENARKIAEKKPCVLFIDEIV
jgi:SpoVK/Ycf46/Vps4 family AAA+-type ATPase